MTAEKSQRKSLAKRHLFDNTDFNVYDKNIINLSVGAPGPDLLRKCCGIFEKATLHRMNAEAKTDADLFQYGSAIGNIDVRAKLAVFLTEAYGTKVYQEDLVLTSGASYGLHHILSTLIDVQGVIFVDEVTYMIALTIFEQFSNMKVIPVKLNGTGVDTNNLEDLLKQNAFKCDKRKIFWGMYYTIPTYHNPTGILFSEDVCRKIVALARKYDILVVCDDVYNLLNYKSETPPKRLYEYDDYNDESFQGNVISNASFSKTIAPGFRMGWMECPPRCVEVFNSSALLKSGGCPSNYNSGILQSLLELDLVQPHIEMMAHHYKKRMLIACDVLKKELPKECSFTQPEGGYFLWILLPKDSNATMLNKLCNEKYKINFIPGSTFSTNTELCNYLRIAIAFHAEDVLEDAMKKLCAAIREFCKLK